MTLGWKCKDSSLCIMHGEHLIWSQLEVRQPSWWSSVQHIAITCFHQMLWLLTPFVWLVILAGFTGNTVWGHWSKKQLMYITIFPVLFCYTCISHCQAHTLHYRYIFHLFLWFDVILFCTNLLFATSLLLSVFSKICACVSFTKNLCHWKILTKPCNVGNVFHPLL